MRLFCPDLPSSARLLDIPHDLMTSYLMEILPSPAEAHCKKPILSVGDCLNQVSSHIYACLKALEDAADFDADFLPLGARIRQPGDSASCSDCEL